MNEDNLIKGKKQAIKTILGVDELELDNLSSEQLDELLAKAGASLNENIESILGCMEMQEANKATTVDALKVIAGFKLDEAEDIYQDRLDEKNRKSKVKEVLKTLKNEKK